MKRGCWKQAVAVFLVSAFVVLGRVPAASAQMEVDIDSFHDALAPYGHWVDVESYGRVWYPVGVPTGWRPYTDGHWSWTDDYGWMWVSDWDWGWAPFHYGSWDLHAIYGWIWIPDTVWAPAWVVWRCGDGFAGWAPLSPRFHRRHGGWRVSAEADYDRHIHSNAWVFVEENRVLDPRLSTVIVHQSRNPTIIQRPGIRYTSMQNRSEHMYNPGLPLHRVEEITHRQVPRLRVVEMDRPFERRSSLQEPGRVHVYKPLIRQRPMPSLPRETARPERVVPGPRPMRPALVPEHSRPEPGAPPGAGLHGHTPRRLEEPQPTGNAPAPGRPQPLKKKLRVVR